MLEKISVLVDEAFRSDMRKVAQDLLVKGFVLDDVLEGIGVLLGSAPSHVINALSEVPGVKFVEAIRNDYRADEE